MGDEDKGGDVSKPGCEVLWKNLAHVGNSGRGIGRRGADGTLYYRAGGPTIMISHVKSAFAKRSHGMSLGHEFLRERLRRAIVLGMKISAGDRPATTGAENSRLNTGIKTVKIFLMRVFGTSLLWHCSNIFRVLFCAVELS